MAIVAPSILSADFLQLGKEIEMINNSDAQWVHVDVMDGVFVPNISYGIPVVKAIRAATQKIIDVHLMIIQPERYFTPFIQAGADVITFHYEASTHLHRSLQQLKESGIKAGVALNPHTPVELLADTLPFLDMVLLMSVNPGFGGQKFIETTFDKIIRLKKMIHHSGRQIMIQVDGGIDMNNTPQLTKAGVDILVAGNTIFGSSNPTETISRLAAL
jgi:ribulose-phosphate 3-epimerase